MKYNKGFAPLVILLIIVGVLAVAGVAYFAGKNSSPKNEIADNSNYSPMTEQNYTAPTTNNNPLQQKTPPPANNPQQQQTPPSTATCATSITVLSPNGGEVYSNTNALRVTWESCKIPANATLVVELLYGTDGIMTAFVPNTGSYTFQLSPTTLMNPPVPPSQPVTYGKHFKVHVGTSPGTSPSYHDSSDNQFTIQ